MSFNIVTPEFRFKYSIDPAERTSNFEHYHTTYELLYFINGNATAFINHQKFVLSPYTLILVKPGDYHYIEINPGETYERLVLRFPPELLPISQRVCLENLQNFYEINGTLLHEELMKFITFDRVFKTMNTNESDVIYMFTHHLLVTVALFCSSPRKESTARVNNELQTILQYIDAHFREIKTIEDICSHVNMSKSKLHRFMSGYMKTTAMSYVNNKKCIFADTLINSGFPASKVYSLSGFSDYSTFYRNYCSFYGHSPSEKSRGTVLTE